MTTATEPETTALTIIQTPQIRYQVGPYEMVWTRRPVKDVCTWHHPESRTKRWVGTVSIPDHFYGNRWDGTNPDYAASLAWHGYGFSQPVCQQCAYEEILNFADEYPRRVQYCKDNEVAGYH